MAEQIADGVKSLNFNDSPTSGDLKNESGPPFEDYGFPLTELFRRAVQFYREKEGRVFHLTYKDKVKMVAYTKQAYHGKYQPNSSPDVGFLDVVGNDRKQAWMALGDMSSSSAMTEFVKMLDKLCPHFKAHIQAQKAEIELQEQKRREEEEQKRHDEEEKERRLLEEEAQRQLQMEKQRQLEQENQIRTALNQQTAQQFRQYAEQQCPGNAKQQEELISQLQEQHFQQYMQQVYQQQLLHQQQQYQQLQAMQATQKTGLQGNAPPTVDSQAPPTQQVPPTTVPNGPVAPPSEPIKATPTQNGQHDDQQEEDDEEELPPIAAASMWTRKDIKEFKESLKKDKDSVIKVGSGETVTVRVPTHEDGSCLFWEFASDSYDIGFGVYFEWTISPSNNVSVHVSESSDEEELEEEEGKSNDVERGGKRDDRPPMDEIIPVYRRDCHEEVYCGSHTYPGRGVYLLKFDNSYSLWRPKTLYYRVYYSR